MNSWKPYSSLERETSHQEISRPRRAVTAKKCIKKCNARAELLFTFLTFSLLSLSSLLELPKDDDDNDSDNGCGDDDDDGDDYKDDNYEKIAVIV